MCSDKEFNWVWNSAEITPFDLDHFCTVKATKQNHVWVFFPRESFPVALSFCFWTTSRAYLPVWTTGSTHGENSIVILALIMTEVLTSKAEAIIRVADPAVFSHFIEKTVGLTPPPSPPTPLMLQFSFIPLSSSQRIWSSLNSCYQTSYRFGWLCAWTAWRTRMSFLHLIFRS